MAMPIIRLEIGGMKHQVLVALDEYQMKMDEDIKAALEAYCEPENISKIVKEAATAAIEATVKDEVRHFFEYGNGRKAIKAAVNEYLSGGLE